MASAAVERAIFALGADTQQYQQSMDAAAASANKAADAGGRVEASSERVTRATRTTADSLTRLEARVDNVVRLEQRRATELERINRIVADGNATQERAAAVAAKVNDFYSAQIIRLRDIDQASRRAGAGMGGFGASAGQSAEKIRQLGYQTQDFFIQVQGGTSALLAFSQQAGQLAGAFLSPQAALIATGLLIAAMVGKTLLLTDATEDAAEAQQKLAEAIAASNKLLLSDSDQKFLTSAKAKSDALEKLKERAEKLGREYYALQQAAIAAEQAKATPEIGGEFGQAGGQANRGALNATIADAERLKRELIDIEERIDAINKGRLTPDERLKDYQERFGLLVKEGEEVEKQADQDRDFRKERATGWTEENKRAKERIDNAQKLKQAALDQLVREGELLDKESQRTKATGEGTRQENARAKAVIDANKAIDDQVAGMRESRAALGLDERARAQQVEVMRAEAIARRANIDLTEEQIATIRREAGALYDQREINDRAKKASELAVEPFKNAVSGIQGAFADAFEGIFDGSVNLTDSLKRVFTRFAAEIAALLIFRPIVGGVLNSFGLGNLAQQLGLGGAVGGAGAFAMGASGTLAAGLPGSDFNSPNFGPAGGGGFDLSSMLGLTGQSGFLGGGLQTIVGGAGIGFAAPQLLRSLGLGIGSGSPVGSGIGSIGGALLGNMLLPGIGGILGGVAGGFLGDIVGGLFGGGGKDKDEIAREQFLAQRAQQIAQLQPTIDSFIARGNGPQTSVGQQIASISQEGQALQQQIYDLNDVSRREEINQAIRAQIKKVQDDFLEGIADATQAITDAGGRIRRDLDKTAEELRKSAKEAGVGFAEVEALIAAQLAEARRQADSEVALALGAITGDPTAAYNDLVRRQEERLSTVKSLGGDIVQAEALAAAERIQIFKTMSEAQKAILDPLLSAFDKSLLDAASAGETGADKLNAAAAAIKNLGENIDDFLRGLDLSDLSTKAAGGKYAEARSQLEQTAAAARLGDADAAGRVQQELTTFLTLSRGVFGGGDQYQQDYQFARALAGGLGEDAPGLSAALGKAGIDLGAVQATGLGALSDGKVTAAEAAPILATIDELGERLAGLVDPSHAAVTELAALRDKLVATRDATEAAAAAQPPDSAQVPNLNPTPLPGNDNANLPGWQQGAMAGGPSAEFRNGLIATLYPGLSYDQAPEAARGAVDQIFQGNPYGYLQMGGAGATDTLLNSGLYSYKQLADQFGTWVFQSAESQIGYLISLMNGDQGGLGYSGGPNPGDVAGAGAPPGSDLGEAGARGLGQVSPVGTPTPGEVAAAQANPTASPTAAATAAAVAAVDQAIADDKANNEKGIVSTSFIDAMKSFMAATRGGIGGLGTPGIFGPVMDKERKDYNTGDDTGAGIGPDGKSGGTNNGTDGMGGGTGTAGGAFALGGWVDRDQRALVHAREFVVNPDSASVNAALLEGINRDPYFMRGVESHAINNNEPLDRFFRPAVTMAAGGDGWRQVATAVEHGTETSARMLQGVIDRLDRMSAKMQAIADRSFAQRGQHHAERKESRMNVGRAAAASAGGPRW